MAFAILVAAVGTQKHSRSILLSDRERFKRVGLHYINFLDSSIAVKDTCLIARFEID
jgi:hypothetical protein